MNIQHYSNKYGEEVYYIKEKLSCGQTLEFGFQLMNYDISNNYWNIYISIYSKRKHKGRNEDNIICTGKGNPFEALKIIKQALPNIESDILTQHCKINNIFYVHWIDSRRRDVYYHFLKRYGYNYGWLDNKKVIIKRKTNFN